MNIRILFFSILLASAHQYANAETLRLSKPVQANDISETFGLPLEVLPDAIEISALLHTPDEYLEKAFTVEARVAKVCQKKGCFFIAQQQDNAIRVAFKDYGFFVPTDIAGRRVTLVGELVAREVSTQQADHFSKDLGEEGWVASGQVYEIVASSVRVPTN